MICDARREREFKFSGSKYYRLDAETKMDKMVDALVQDTDGVDEYNYAGLADLFRQRSNRTTCNSADELPM